MLTLISWSYLIPIWISIMYFCALQLQYKKDKKILVKNKLSFKQTIILCFIPVLNWITVYISIKMSMISIINPKESISILKPQIHLIIAGSLFICLSIIALIIFSIKTIYFIHPGLYIITLLIGIGWLLTGIYSIKK